MQTVKGTSVWLIALFSSSPQANIECPRSPLGELESRYLRMYTVSMEMDCPSKTIQSASEAYCNRCSGIHRGMGTHISRVKSVDLDSWTDEQLASVVRWGNARANKYIKLLLLVDTKSCKPELISFKILGSEASSRSCAG